MRCFIKVGSSYQSKQKYMSRETLCFQLFRSRLWGD